MTWHYLDENCESSSYSPARAGESSGTTSSVTVPCALSRLLPIRGGCCLPDNETAHCLTASPFGMMPAHSTGDHGGGGQMSYLVATRASRTRQRVEAGGQQVTSGLKCFGSFERSVHGMSLLKMSAGPRSSMQLASSEAWDIPVYRLPKCRPPHWVRRITARDGGYLPTPTAKANAFAPSMQKWPAYRALQAAYGPSQGPRFWEMMMGWPIGWTDCEPLEMVKYQQWRRSHGGCLAGRECHEMSQPADAGERCDT